MAARVVIPVWTGSLPVEADLPPSAKIDEQRADQIARSISEVNRRLARGWTERDLLALRQSSVEGERLVGETFGALYREESASAIKVRWFDGKLEVLNGHHRIEGARREGVEVLPVQVVADNQQSLSAATNQLRESVERGSNRPAVAEALAAHDRLVGQRMRHRDERGLSQRER